MTDFSWNPFDPWTIGSHSDDIEGGSTLQLWRMHDWLWSQKRTMIQEIEEFVKENV